MRPKFVVTIGAVVLVGALYFAATVMATPSQGFFATTLAKGTLGEVNVFNHEVLDAPATDKPPGSNVWVSLQKTQGTSDLYVQSNLWVPGGSTGWHTHPGHSLITVTEGAVTVYESDDPSCTPHVYTPGMTFVDEGGDHVHLIRNEGSVDAKTIAVQLIPAGAVRRIDAPAPSNCGF
jgi:quercetin dioxygenase-like cupin family protein